MRLIKYVIIMMFFATLANADEIVPAFGSGVSIAYDRPDTKIWKLEASKEELSKGVVMFKRQKITDANGLDVEPVLSIVYEKTPPEVNDIDKYVEYARGKTQYEVIKAIVIPNGTVVFFCFYRIGDVGHSLTIGHLYKDGIGVQVIGDSTLSVLKDVEDDKKSFFSSVSLKKK